jgi:Zn-dependent protease/predicted transcriptional regulator
MKWSWKIAQIAGIGVYVHATFFLLLVWVGFSSMAVRQSWQDAVAAILFVLVLFAIVLMHEFGHALTARRYGIGTRDIILLPIGGIARLERMPENPKQELVIALAGPAVNVVLAALLAGILLVMGGVQTITNWQTPAGILTRLMWVNVILAVFNLLPAFPMDGGRVLRGLLALTMDYARATRIAARVGQAMAFVLGFVGLMWNPFLILIAFFVWWGASQEADLVEMKSALQRVPVNDLMITEFHKLSPRDHLALAVDHILAGWQYDFPVVDHGGVIGVLTRNDLLAGLTKAGQGAEVGEFMHRECLTVSPSEMAESAFGRLQRGQCNTVPVVENGTLVGLLTMENVGEYLMIQSALAHPPGSGSNPGTRWQPA